VKNHSRVRRHFAVAFGASGPCPRVSWRIVHRVSARDLVWPLLVIAGIERYRCSRVTIVTPLDFIYYPFFAQPPGAAAWAAVFGRVRGLRRARADRRRVLALSCVPLGARCLTHRPDMPLTMSAESARVGLGLWKLAPRTMAVELLLFAAGSGSTPGHEGS